MCVCVYVSINADDAVEMTHSGDRPVKKTHSTLLTDLSPVQTHTQTHKHAEQSPLNTDSKPFQFQPVRIWQIWSAFTPAWKTKKIKVERKNVPPSEIYIFRGWRITSLRPFKLSVSINRTWLLYKMFKHVAEQCFSQAASWIWRDPASFFLSSFLVLERVLSSLFNFPTVCLCFGGNVKTLSSSLVFTGN